MIKELGPHSESGANIQILSGRYGPYVTDGSVNASIPKNIDPEQVDLDDALDLLEKARARKGKGRSRNRGGGSRGSGDGSRKPGGGKKKR